MRFLLPGYLLIYIVAAFVWRSVAVWRRTGINPVTFKGTDSAHDFIGLIFKLLFALIIVVVVLHSFFTAYYPLTKPFHMLERPLIRLIGWGLLSLSLVWTVIAQGQMGESWRIGIDDEHSTPLVQRGIFKLSRNPIFLGMMTTMLGLFLVIPSAMTMLTLVVGVVVISVQVRLEEEFLRGQHGDAYVDYCRRVRRWI